MGIKEIDKLKRSDNKFTDFDTRGHRLRDLTTQTEHQIHQIRQPDNL